MSAYSAWFILHWFTYGASILVWVIYMSKEFLVNPPVTKLVYLGYAFVYFLYIFLLPCICAARITSHCTGKIHIC